MIDDQVNAEELAESRAPHGKSSRCASKSFDFVTIRQCLRYRHIRFTP